MITASWKGDKDRMKLSTAQYKMVDQKVDHWLARLLDLSGRNRLLYFKETKTTTISVKVPAPEDLFTRLVEKGEGLWLANPSAASFSGWATMIASCLRDDYRSLTDPATGAPPEAAGRGGLTRGGPDIVGGGAECPTLPVPVSGFPAS